MPFWPFKRGKRDDEAFFTSTGGAQVVPAAPPGVAETGPPATSAATPPSSAAPPAVSTTAGALPEAIRQQLAAAGIHLDANANVQVSTQTTELSGRQALQFLGQLTSALGSAKWAGASVQMHPQVTMIADGRLQESPEKLKASGVDAKATVRDLEEKLAMAGDTHLVKLKLLVERDGIAPYETTTAAIVPAGVTEQFAEGKTFPAKVDPNDPNQVLVLFS